ncbi:MAG: hypothetical protein F6K26_44155 [Moorea sp. SIO2I5]|nr:hypothetical protein [Moorena sp. SIO2I5]
MALASCVELASCQFPPYFRAGRMPTLLLFIQRLTQRLQVFLSPPQTLGLTTDD